MALGNSIKPAEWWFYDAQSHKYGQFEKRLHIIRGQMQIHHHTPLHTSVHIVYSIPEMNGKWRK